MIATPPAARCAATVGHHVGEYGEVPIQCHQQRGLRTWDGLPYCPVHQRHVMAIARRLRTERTFHEDCGGYLDARGCSNPSCPKWRGPSA